MAKTYQIKIESILGGQSPLTHYSKPDQFRSSIGIDPTEPVYSDTDSFTTSGLLVPIHYYDVTKSLNNAPMWIKNAGQTAATYVYDAGGSVYTLSSAFSYQGGLSDGDSMTNSSGNGMAYYDNYMYFAKDTDIARYGPLNGIGPDPSFDGTYWTNTLSKTALVNTSYPYPNSSTLAGRLPNHVLHRHVDGRLYIADVVDNQGTIHYISTTKTTLEGDTDNGSTYNALQFGYGLWPTAIESYGDYLVIALYENNSSGVYGVKAPPAKLAFWDTTSDNFNLITNTEFPDGLITGLRNINGTLYIVSTDSYSRGFRVCRYVGGTTFKDVGLFEQGLSPYQGALDGNSERLLFGSATMFGNSTISPGQGCAYSLGLRKSGISDGWFVVGSTTTTNASVVSSLLLNERYVANGGNPMLGWTTASTHGLSRVASSGNNSVSIWQSREFNIGRPFKITKIRIPLAQSLVDTVYGDSITIVPKIYTDKGNGETYTLQTISSAIETGQFNVVRRADSSGATIVGQNNFWLELQWTGVAHCVVSLPIVIEYELIDD